MVKQFAGSIKIESSGEGKGAKVSFQMKMKLKKFSDDPENDSAGNTSNRSSSLQN